MWRIGLIGLIFFDATIGRAEAIAPGYAIFVQRQVVEGDIGCMSPCGPVDACSEPFICTAIGDAQVCLDPDQAAPVGPCAAHFEAACHQGSICVQLNDGAELLDEFIAHKQRRGFDVHVVYETDYLDGSEVGEAARAHKARGWLAAHQTPLNLRYALILAAPGAGSPMPMLATHPRNNASEPWAQNLVVPSDTFYAELDGNWDLDGDGFFAEFNSADADPSGDMGEDGVHFEADIWIGRIPYYASVSAIDVVLAKTMRYQNAAPDSIAWRRHALLAAEGQNRYFFGEQIRTDLLDPNGYSYHRIYDALCFDEVFGDRVCTHPLAEAPETSLCSVAGVGAAWAASPPGIVAWLTHGSGQGAASVMSMSMARSLPTERQAFTFQASCNNSSPVGLSNISLELLRGPVVAAVGATAVSHGPGSPIDLAQTAGNAGMAYAYVQRLIEEGMSAGQALADLRQDVYPGRWWELQNYLGFVLYGDPELSLSDTALPAQIEVIGDPVVAEGASVELRIGAQASDGSSVAVELAGLRAFMTWDTGVLALRPDFDDAGSYELTITSISEPPGQRLLRIEVTDVNRAPTLACPIGLVPDECVFIAVSDGDGDEVTIRVDGVVLGFSEGEGITVCRAGKERHDLSAADAETSTGCTVRFVPASPSNPAIGCSCDGLGGGVLLWLLPWMAMRRRQSLDS